MIFLSSKSGSNPQSYVKGYDTTAERLKMSSCQTKILKYSFLFSVQNSIRECMDQIEISINLSMSGASFQPAQAPASTTTTASTTPSQVQIPSGPKMISHSTNFYGGNSASTTPTDIMECSTLNVY